MDTGVKFAQRGVPTLVTTNFELSIKTIESFIEVLSINVDSRHDTPKVAYEKISVLIKHAKQYNIKYIYKKTDSALRGNIGAELEAVLNEFGIEQLPFIPAYPSLNRQTIKGCLYINGIPVNESVYANDPFSPVKSFLISDVIRKQSDLPITIISDYKYPERNGILIFDSIDNEDLEKIGIELKKKNKLFITAGCAGFAEYLPDLIGLKKSDILKPEMVRSMLVISGSANKITQRQIGYVREINFPVFTLTKEIKFDKDFVKTPKADAFMRALEEEIKEHHIVIIESVKDKLQMYQEKEYAAGLGIPPEEYRTCIKANIGEFGALLIEKIKPDVLVIFGGDTLMGIMEKLDCNGIIPMVEIIPGTAVGKIYCPKYAGYMVTKSGGFGEENIIKLIMEYFKIKIAF
jgi:uncharacterized protein YgbK (DUF1537 family)